MRLRTSRSFSSCTLDFLGSDINSGVDHVDVRFFSRLYDFGMFKPRMKVGAVMSHRRFHQLPGLDILPVRALPSGHMHPMIECAGMASLFRSNNAQPRLAKNSVEVTSS